MSSIENEIRKYHDHAENSCKLENFYAAYYNLDLIKHIALNYGISPPGGYKSLERTVGELGVEKHMESAIQELEEGNFYAADYNLANAEHIASKNDISLPEEYDSLKRSVNELGVKEHIESAIQELEEGNFYAADDDLTIAEIIASKNDIRLPKGYESLKRSVGELGVKKHIESAIQELKKGNFYAADADLTNVEHIASRHRIRPPKRYKSLRRTVGKLVVETYMESAIQELKKGNFKNADDDLTNAEHIASRHRIRLPKGYESLKRSVGKLGVEEHMESARQELKKGNFKNASYDLNFVKHIASRHRISPPEEYDSLKKRLSELYSERKHFCIIF